MVHYVWRRSGDKSDNQLGEKSHGCGGTSDVTMFRRPGGRHPEGPAGTVSPKCPVPQGAGGLARGLRAGQHEVRLGLNREQSPSKGPGCVVTVRLR